VVKEAQESLLGYKAFIGVDKENGSIQATHVPSANRRFIP